MRLLLLGATGLVGSTALKQALAEDAISEVVAPTRRPLAPQNKLVNPVNLRLEELAPRVKSWSVDAVVCALGTTKAKAGSQIQPHLRLIESGHDVDTLVLEIRESAKRNGGVPRAVSANRIKRAKSATPVYLAIHRFELVVHYKRLDAEMFRLVNTLAKGVSIADAVEVAYSESTLTPEQCQQHIQDSFALFAALGWFCKPGSSAN